MKCGPVHAVSGFEVPGLRVHLKVFVPGRESSLGESRLGESRRR